MVRETGQEIGFPCSRERREKLVSSDFAKILEVVTKIRETCEKTLLTPPSPIKATNSIVSV
jgi:hypothetical protein